MPAFMITIPITVGLNVAVQGYKYQKGRVMKKQLESILVGANCLNDDNRPASIVVCPVQVKTKHTMSVAHMKEKLTTPQTRYVVAIKLDGGERLILVFKKQFWNDVSELADLNFILENVDSMDVKFHTHDGSSPLEAGMCQIESLKNPDGSVEVILKPTNAGDAAWYHRSKEWSLSSDQPEDLLRVFEL